MPSKKSRRKSISVNAEFYVWLRRYVESTADQAMGPIVENLLEQKLNELQVPRPTEVEVKSYLNGEKPLSLNNPESRGLTRDPRNVRSMAKGKERKEKRLLMDQSQNIMF